jgi:HAD superfamily hydrolase (TIGR01509 family)
MRGKSIHAVIFDLGGVLIDVDPLQGVRSLASQIPNRSEQEILDWFSKSQPALDYELGLLSDEDFYRESIRAFEIQYAFEDFSRAWTGIFSPIQSMIDLLPAFAEEMPIYLLSNTNRLHVEFLIRHFSFFNMFRKTYYSHEIHLRKPDHAFFSHVICDAQLDPSSCLFIDDKAENVHAAFACGFKACLYEVETRIRPAPDFQAVIFLEKFIESGCTFHLPDETG